MLGTRAQRAAHCIDGAQIVQGAGGGGCAGCGWVWGWELHAWVEGCGCGMEGWLWVRKGWDRHRHSMWDVETRCGTPIGMGDEDALHGLYRGTVWDHGIEARCVCGVDVSAGMG